MNAPAEQRDWFRRLLPDAGRDNAETQPEWMERIRAEARAAVAELPVPHRKQEAWRYTSIDGLLDNSFRPGGEESGREIPRLEDHLEPLEHAWRLVFVNGRYHPALSSPESPAGISMGSLREMLIRDPARLATWFEQTRAHTGEIFTALNTALINDGLYLHLAAGVHLEHPVEVIHLHLDRETAMLTQPRNLVVLEAGAKATLVERFVGAAKAVYFHNTVSELVLEKDADLTHYRLQDESGDAYHLSALHLRQEKGSRYRGTSLSYGGRWARTDIHTAFRAEGARCELYGLYTVGDRQLADFHLDVRHSVPGCTSRERFKGILHGRGRAVFDGSILVEKQAQHSDAQLANDNLMLTRDAEVDTKPQLEIHADDVKCSHGTTVGQLDPQQVYYLRSRGITETEARRMLCQGFAGEIIDTIAIPALRDLATERMSAILDPALDGQQG